MDPIKKVAPFAILSTGHGTMIVNRNDYRLLDEGGYGVGYQLFNQSLFDPDEVSAALQLLSLRRKHFGDGVVALDCGANIGVHTVEWARHMTGWGTVVGIEAQERIYYALAGNVAINNLFNARVLHAAVGGEEGVIGLPALDYTQPSSFGSFEVRQRPDTEFIGQAVDYTGGGAQDINLISIDALECERVDLIKLDIEGMELEALGGAIATLTAHKPMLMVEIIKCPPGSVQAHLESLGYSCIPMGLNVLAIHRDDPCSAEIGSR